jgi:hypothetical protein
VARVLVADQCPVRHRRRQSKLVARENALGCATWSKRGPNTMPQSTPRNTVWMPAGTCRTPTARFSNCSAAWVPIPQACTADPQPGAKNYAQLAQCFQCHIITVNSTGANYGLGDDNRNETISNLSARPSTHGAPRRHRHGVFTHSRAGSQPAAVHHLPLPTLGATQGLVVATQSWNFTTSTHAVFTVPTASAPSRVRGGPSVLVDSTGRRWGW